MEGLLRLYASNILRLLIMLRALFSVWEWHRSHSWLREERICPAHHQSQPKWQLRSSNICTNVVCKLPIIAIINETVQCFTTSVSVSSCLSTLWFSLRKMLLYYQFVSGTHFPTCTRVNSFGCLWAGNSPHCTILMIGCYGVPLILCN